MTSLNFNLRACCMALLTLPSYASATNYFNDFQGTVNNEWSSTTTTNALTPYPAGARTFLGEFGAETVFLDLAGLDAHDEITLNFDLYLLRTWDGSSGGASLYDYGNDVFKVGVNGGAVLLEDTFSNGNPAGQTYGPNTHNANMTGSIEQYSLGYTFYDGIQKQTYNQDSVYHFSFTFDHNASDIQFNFSGIGLQDKSDESWGLDNVQVSFANITSPVPEPSLMTMMTLGLLLVGWRRYRNIVATI